MTTLREIFKKTKKVTKETADKVLDTDLENLKPSEEQIKNTKMAVSDFGKVALAFVGLFFLLYFIAYISEGGYFHETLLFGSTGLITYLISKRFLLGFFSTFLVFLITLIILFTGWTITNIYFEGFLHMIGFVYPSNRFSL